MDPHAQERSLAWTPFSFFPHPFCPQVGWIVSQQCVGQESSVLGAGEMQHSKGLPGLEAAAGVFWKLKG